MRWADDDGLTLVEMLIVMVILGVVAAGTTGAILTMLGQDQFTEEVRQVTDEGRVSMDRVRKELRGGRRVLELSAGNPSNASHLFWWVDQNQNGLQESFERVHYCVHALTGTISNPPTCVAAGQTGQFRLIRFTEADTTDVRTLASTLTSSDVFTGYAPTVTETSTVTITYRLQVLNDDRGPQELVLDGSVRLRNVA